MSGAAGSRQAMLLACLLAACTGQERPAGDGTLVDQLELPGAGPQAVSQPGETGLPDMERPCSEGEGLAPDDAAAALVPLVEGLTLASTWWGEAGSDDDYEHECLTHVVRISSVDVVLSSSCPTGRDRTITRGQRRVCRSDLEHGSIYITRRGPNSPEMIAGSTADLLSRSSLRALRATGALDHREMAIHRPDPLENLLNLARVLAGASAPDTESNPTGAGSFVVEHDVRGRLDTLSADTIELPINGRAVALPVLRLAGVLEAHDGAGPSVRRTMAVLDDDRAPWVLDLLSETTGRRIRIDWITYPAGETLERDLAADRETTLHGVYFEPGSDALREESAAVLVEVADVLRRNPDWKLAVHGHTDDRGGEAANRDLSERRADAVRRALVEGHGIDGSRLTTSGYGATQPLDTNETPEGRARNRRVDLVRQ